MDVSVEERGIEVFEAPQCWRPCQVRGGEGDGDVNRVQGNIQMASKSGMGTGMHMNTVEAIKEY